MAMYRTGTVAPVISILGKDPEAGATFNADTTPAVGVLKAGTIMKYDGATKVLAKATLPTDIGLVAGILADDIDTGPVGTTEVQAVMVYRKGVFRQQAIESANNLAILPGDTNALALRDKGIYLELEYEGYEGVSPVPAGVQAYSSTGPSA